MSINWKVRFKNKSFWVGIVGALGICVVAIAATLGFDITDKVDGIVENLDAVIAAVFSLATILGVVTDPTTAGVSDSDQALTYTEPKVSGEDADEDGADV